jgi:hypothetical protein
MRSLHSNLNIVFRGREKPKEILLTMFFSIAIIVTSRVIWLQIVLGRGNPIVFIKENSRLVMINYAHIN